jgi:signal transduction histidine kinase
MLKLPPPDTATARLYWQSVLLLVALFGACKLLAYTLVGWVWPPFGLTDIVALSAIAVVVGIFTRYRLLRLHRAMEVAARRRAATEAREARHAENEVALRVARAVTREFAQPLSGALGYSELLMMRAESFAGCERRELEGMREGVLQMERLLQTLRQTIDATPCATSRRVVDDVERCVAEPRPRLQVRGAMAAVQGAGSEPN